MGPQSYMRSIVDWNDFMQRMTVIIESMAKIFPLNAVGLHVMVTYTTQVDSMDHQLSLSLSLCVCVCVRARASLSLSLCIYIYIYLFI
jgi:preprotein translocase subunit SecG